MRSKRRVLAAIAAIGLLAAGCGGSSDDDAGSATSGGDGGAASASARSDRAVQFAECMRENGVSDFPDPVDGRVMLRVGPGGLQVDPGVMQAAQEACQDYAPSGAGGGPQADQMQERALAFAQCMRDNGVPEFPDPQVQGGGVRMTLPRGVDPQSPQFQQAQQACQGEMAGIGAP